MSPSVSTESFAESDLLAGSFPLEVESVVVSSGQNLARGAVLGRITVSGEYVLSLSAAGDGSEVIRGVLAEAVDSTGGDVTALAYVTGKFNQNKLTFGTGHNPATVATQNAMADRNLYLVDSVQA